MTKPLACNDGDASVDCRRLAEVTTTGCDCGGKRDVVSSALVLMTGCCALHVKVDVSMLCFVSFLMGTSSGEHDATAVATRCTSIVFAGGGGNPKGGEMTSMTLLVGVGVQPRYGSSFSTTSLCSIG